MNYSKDKKRVGFYCWAGPGTIRMINLKFFNPKIDIHSLMTSYDYEYLSKVKDVFGITDFWATYSWGFSIEREQEDYHFLLSKVENFKKLGLTLHAYIQGPNLVYEDYKNYDWFCKDNENRLVTYYRGRKVVCINNPEYQDYVQTKLLQMRNRGFDGVYMDNIQMGQIPIPSYSKKPPFIFAGCTCVFCCNKFHKDCGLSIPTDFEKNESLTKQYLSFRVKCVTEFLETVAHTVHQGKMVFGSNSFDPKFNTRELFGTNLTEINHIQDYLLFENHSLPNKKTNNSYITDLCKNFTKPVFVVSYKSGIGIDNAYSQEDFDNIFSEKNNGLWHPCLKGTEYFTKRKWHNLYINNYTKPHRHSLLDIKSIRVKKRHSRLLFRNPLVRSILKKYYNPAITLFMENKFVRYKFMWFMKRSLKY